MRLKWGWYKCAKCARWVIRIALKPPQKEPGWCWDCNEEARLATQA
jgi:hypothetical protein